MHRSVERLKPGVKRKVHLLASGAVWSLVGVFLFYRGWCYLYESHSAYSLLLVALFLGWLKSYFILDRAAGRIVTRILHLSDGSCLGAVYSWKTWILVLAMIGLGVVLRHSGLALSWLGLFYCTIGWALFCSSRHGWRAWRKYR